MVHQYPNYNLVVHFYSAVHDFEDGNVAHSYKTVADLYNNAQQCLRDSNDQPLYIPFATNHIDDLNEVAEAIFEQVTWQHFSSYQPDIANDMKDQPDAYPHCFCQNQFESIQIIEEKT